MYFVEQIAQWNLRDPSGAQSSVLMFEKSALDPFGGVGILVFLLVVFRVLDTGPVVSVRSVLKCVLCGVKNDVPSPLITASPDDAWGGFILWRSYNKKRRPGVKHPNGKLCRICWNAYCALGAGLIGQRVFS